MVTYYEPKLQLIINGTLRSGWQTSNPALKVTETLGGGVSRIDSLNIRGGRADVTLQPSAMQCSVALVIDSASSTPLTDSVTAIGQTLVVNCYDYYNSVWTPIFTGIISDKTIETTNWSNGVGTFTYTFNAYSRMASLQSHRQSWDTSPTNAVCTAGFYVYNRISEVLSNWQYSPSWIGSINTDAIFIEKRAAGTYIDSELIESAAQTGRGCFHDRSDGKVYYNNFANTLQASQGTIDPYLMVAGGLQVNRSITDIVNAIHVTTTASLTDATAASSTSQSNYGYRYGSRDTECAVKTDMTAQANDFLTARANPRWRPGEITIDMGLITSAPTGNASSYPVYLPIRTNTRYTIPLPTSMGGDLDCLVDNWNWSFSRGRMFLTMQLSLVADTHP